MQLPKRGVTAVLCNQVCLCYQQQHVMDVTSLLSITVIIVILLLLLPCLNYNYVLQIIFLLKCNNY